MGNKQKVFFRADAGAQIGYGHFIRTLALADMLKGDFDCTFFTQSPTAYQMEQVAMVCPIVALPSDDTRFDLFLSYLIGDEIVVLDNYFFTSDYQLKIKKKGSKLVCIDDMHDKHYYADIVINQGLGYSQSDYSCENYTRFAFGLKYSLLRKPFLEASKNFQFRTNSEGFRVLVAFGGSDFLNLTSKVINKIINIDAITDIIAIVGDSYKVDSIVNNNKVTYKKNLSAKDLVQLFQSVDCAILPASTMLNEALACGTSIIGGYYVDNQEHDYYMFLQEELIIGVGDYTDIQAMDRVVSGLNRIIRRKDFTITSEVSIRFINLFKSL